MNIGTSIKKVRTEKGIPQGELAEKCELSQTSLSQIEKGIKRPSQKTLDKICKVLDIPETVLYLYNLEEDDIPATKKDIYKALYPTVQDMIKRLL